MTGIATSTKSSNVSTHRQCDHSYSTHEDNTMEPSIATVTSNIRDEDHSYYANDDRLNTSHKQKKNVFADETIKNIASFNKLLYKKHFGVDSSSPVSLPENELQQLSTAIETCQVTAIAEAVLQIPILAKEVKLLLVHETHCAAPFNQRKGNTSVLMKKDYEHYLALQFSDIIKEFAERLPHLFHVILGAAVSSHGLLSMEKIRELIPKMCMIYAIIMQSNFHELSSFQHLVGFLLQDCICEQKVFCHIVYIRVVIVQSNNVNTNYTCYVI